MSYSVAAFWLSFTTGCRSREWQVCWRCCCAQIEAFYLLLNVLPRMEVKEAIVSQGIMPLLINLLTGENGTIVRQASQTIKSLCEVSEYRYMAVDGQVFESLTAGMIHITDKGARVAIAEAIGERAQLNAYDVLSTSLSSLCIHTQGPHYTTIMKPSLKLPPNMAADSLR